MPIVQPFRRRTDVVRTGRCSDGTVTLDVEQDTYSSRYAPLPVYPSVPDAASDTPMSRRATVQWQEVPPEAVQPNLLEVSAFARAMLGAGWDFRRSSFAALLEDVRVRQNHPRLTSDPLALARATNVFDRLCRWLPVKPLCLAKSYCLLRFLAARGLRADWVFGVGLFPFSAHCWVASGSTVLGERADLLRRFTIILTIDGDYS